MYASRKSKIIPAPAGLIVNHQSRISFPPVFPVQNPIMNCSGKVLCGDIGAAIKVGDGTYICK